MSMTKAERERFALLEKDLAEALAFRRTEEVAPDVYPPNTSSKDRMTYGFQPHQYNLDASAEPCASTSVSHYRYYNGKITGGSQRGVRLYSTRLLALQAARYKMECAVAKALAKLDAAIEAERATPTPHPEHEK